jgi:hypothetical protein
MDEHNDGLANELAFLDASDYARQSVHGPQGVLPRLVLVGTMPSTPKLVTAHVPMEALRRELSRDKWHTVAARYVEAALHDPGNALTRLGAPVGFAVQCAAFIEEGTAHEVDRANISVAEGASVVIIGLYPRVGDDLHSVGTITVEGGKRSVAFDQPQAGRRLLPVRRPIRH